MQWPPVAFRVGLGAQTGSGQTLTNVWGRVLPQFPGEEAEASRPRQPEGPFQEEGRAQQDHRGSPKAAVTELEAEEPPSASPQGVCHMLKLY